MQHNTIMIPYFQQGNAATTYGMLDRWSVSEGETTCALARPPVPFGGEFRNRCHCDIV